VGPHEAGAGKLGLDRGQSRPHQRAPPLGELELDIIAAGARAEHIARHRADHALSSSISTGCWAG
jgi:hypothetical protein